MKSITLFVLICAGCLSAQSTPPAAADTWKTLSFLEGNWEAKTERGSAAPTVSGTYTFVKELDGHILARHSRSAECKGPAGFDCEHRDLLYVFQDAPGQPLKALYADSEGHVIHYDVSTPTPTSALFLSDSSQPGPQFRLTYELKNATMFGKFQMQMPGQAEWKSYLEWSGAKK